MPDLTDDPYAQLREILTASKERPLTEPERLHIWGLKTEIDQLRDNELFILSKLTEAREENTALGVRWQEQYDRAEAAASHPCPHIITDAAGTSYCRLAEDATRTTALLDALTETVRDVAESLALGAASPATVALAATTLHTACNQAGEAS